MFKKKNMPEPEFAPGVIMKPSIAGIPNMEHLAGAASDANLARGHQGPVSVDPDKIVGRGTKAPKTGNKISTQTAKAKGVSYGQ